MLRLAGLEAPYIRYCNPNAGEYSRCGFTNPEGCGEYRIGATDLDLGAGRDPLTSNIQNFFKGRRHVICSCPYVPVYNQNSC